MKLGADSRQKQLIFFQFKHVQNQKKESLAENLEKTNPFSSKNVTFFGLSNVPASDQDPIQRVDGLNHILGNLPGQQTFHLCSKRTTQQAKDPQNIFLIFFEYFFANQSELNDQSYKSLSPSLYWLRFDTVKLTSKTAGIYSIPERTEQNALHIYIYIYIHHISSS